MVNHGWDYGPFLSLFLSSNLTLPVVLVCSPHVATGKRRRRRRNATYVGVPLCWVPPPPSPPATANRHLGTHLRPVLPAGKECNKKRSI